MFLPQTVAHYFENLAKRMCKETGEACSHWLDDEKYDALLKKDKKDKTNEAKKYYDSCYFLNAILHPCDEKGNGEVKITLRCEPPYRGCDGYCKASFPKAEKRLLQHFKETEKLKTTFPLKGK